MTDKEVRLECLKIANELADRQINWFTRRITFEGQAVSRSRGVVLMAQKLEQWVNGEVEL